MTSPDAHTQAPRYAVTGATGQIGGRVATRLAARGVALRLVVRDPDRAPQLGDDIEVAQAGYGDAAAMRTALAGVHTLFLVSASESADRLDQHIAAVDAAVAAGVQRLVYLSFLRAAPDATFTFARDHFHTERHIRRTGIDSTFLRPSLYLDLLPHFVDTDGVIRGPAGEGRLAGVARDDLADVAASVLTTEGHEGRTYDVTGPRPFSLDTVARELSRVTGRTITYLPETLEEAFASRAHLGAPEWAVTGWVTSYAAIATGEMDAVSATVERATGRPPLGLVDFLDTQPESYVHLLG